MRIGFVVLHYGDRKVTDVCIRSILRLIRDRKASQKRWEGEEGPREAAAVHIILVDNDVHETWEHRQALKNHYRNIPEISVLTNCGEGGFSEANNLGYAFARNSLGCRCILVLNNDVTFPQRDFLERLEKILEESVSADGDSCHILAPDIVQPDTGERQNPMDHQLRSEQQAVFTIKMNRRALQLFDLAYPMVALQQKQAQLRAVRSRQKKAFEYDIIQKDIVPCGACLIYMPSFVEREEKAFEPETRFFYEEYLLALRCRRKGYRIVYDPVLQVLHESGTATKKAAGSRKRKMRFMMQNTADACEIYLAELSRDGDDCHGGGSGSC